MDSEELVKVFRNRQATKKAENTAYQYGRVAGIWVDWLENPGEKDFDTNRRNRSSKAAHEATTPDIRIFLRQQLDSGLSGGTVEKRRWAISTFYGELGEMAEEGYSVPEFEDPTAGLDVSDWQDFNTGGRKEEELKEVYYLEPEEIDELAENATSPTLRNELIIRLLYQTGLRRQELAETRVGDVTTDKRAINVHANKTHRNRTVYYTPSLNTILKRWLNVERGALSTAGSEYLFPTRESEQISPKTINRIVRKAAEAAGLQAHVYDNAAGDSQMKVTAHVLRHSCAVQCLKNRMDTRTLQKLMGHAKIDTTEQYLRLSESDVRDSARKYGAGTE